MFKKVRLHVKITASILIPILIMIVISNIVTIINVKKISGDLSYKVLEEASNSEVNKLKSVVKEEYYSVTTLKYVIENMYNNNIRDRIAYDNIIAEYLYNLPKTVVGVMLAFEPNTIGNDSNYINEYPYTKGQQTYYMARVNGQDSQVVITSEDLKSDYYTVPIKTSKTYLSGVYDFDLGNNNMVKMYTWSVPIISSNKVIGVITGDVLVDTLMPTMKAINPFTDSMGLLFDNYGNLLYDVSNLDNIGINVYDLYPQYKKYNVTEEVTKGNIVYFESYSEYYKGYASYLFVPLEIVEGQHWMLEIIGSNNSIYRDSNMLQKIVVIISVFIIVIASIITPIIIRMRVSNIIGELAKDMSNMANGDLTISSLNGFSKRTDEWGDIARGWEKAMDNFNSIINTVKNSAGRVSDAANSVLEGNTDLSSRTESQAASLEETSASMNEIASTIKESAENVSNSADVVNDTKNKISKAGEIIEESVQKMDDVYEASAKIMDITKLIEGIAFQTNILALNASVEAARAGEQGRGFAVVASEVRNLAQNTQESVKNITALITDSYKKIHLAAESVKESQNIFTDITNQMDNASQLMDKINIAAQEQEKGIEQVNTAINNMDSAVQQNASLVTEVASASESLLSEANELVKSIAYFKLR
ncbi:methyl-accepting chemotaxis protein [Brachyspira pulli]|uniref:methyl-accepting chemotaxis protein n=1 Tax=Brachyspira pulli TaxID=310721 RepID=UPI003005A15C